MDEEMVEFVRKAFEGGEIDMDYEFDAPKFYDFTRPETGREAEEAEEWFLSAEAFLEKLLNWKKGIHLEPVKNSAEPKDVEEVDVIRCSDSNNCMEAEVSAVVDDNIRELPIHMAQNIPSAKPKYLGKSPPLSRSSPLMKPTASQLAKQNHCREVHSNQLLRRVAKKLWKLDEKSQNSPPPTKRQKLEAGYVRKVAEQLKHQPLWLHKVPKKVGADAARPKVTVSKEPNLETANRAQGRQENNQKFIGLLHGLARKKHNSSNRVSGVLPSDISASYATDIRSPQNETTDGPNSCYLSENETTEIEGPNSVYALQEKSGMVYKCVACSLKNKELKFAIDKRCLKEPRARSLVAFIWLPNEIQVDENDRRHERKISG